MPAREVAVSVRLTCDVVFEHRDPIHDIKDVGIRDP
jgi:hypothetical protein